MTAIHGLLRRYQYNATNPATVEGWREAIECTCGAQFEAPSMKLVNERFEDHVRRKGPEAQEPHTE